MKGTIKAKLTAAVIIIVVAAMLISTFIIVRTSSIKLSAELTEQQQINADKYANSINSWIAMEKGLNDASAGALRSLSDAEYDAGHIQLIVSGESENRPELLREAYL